MMSAISFNAPGFLTGNVYNLKHFILAEKLLRAKLVFPDLFKHVGSEGFLKFLFGFKNKFIIDMICHFKTKKKILSDYDDSFQTTKVESMIYGTILLLWIIYKFW